MELKLLSALADEYVIAREARLAADRAAKALKETEVVLAKRLIAQLVDNDVGMVGGTLKRVTLQKKSKPQAADWPAVYKYIIENDATDLLQRRFNEEAVKARFDEGDPIPGIEYYEVNSLSVSKL